ncbi:MAG: septation protein A [Pseudomonadota bacterium]
MTMQDAARPQPETQAQAQAKPQANIQGKTQAQGKQEPVSPTLKMALEMGPVVLFVISYAFGENIAGWLGLTGILQQPIFLATAVIMVATAVSIGLSLYLMKHVPAMPIVTLVVVTIFGGLTLYLQDDTFIKMKPTIVNCLFGTALLVGLAFGKSFLKTVMGMAFPIDDEGWMKLTLRWGLFFFFLAAVNEVVWRNTSEAFWVGFKFYGMTGLTFLFVMTQVPLLQRHSLEEETDA